MLQIVIEIEDGVVVNSRLHFDENILPLNARQPGQHRIIIEVLYKYTHWDADEFGLTEYWLDLLAVHTYLDGEKIPNLDLDDEIKVLIWGKLWDDGLRG